MRDSNTTRTHSRDGSPQQSQGAISIVATAFNAHTRNSLQGFADLVLLDVGLKIAGSTLHEKDGSRWVGLPARKYQGDDGEAQYSKILEFASKESYWAFQDAALAAIDEFQSREGV